MTRLLSSLWLKWGFALRSSVEGIISRDLLIGCGNHLHTRGSWTELAAPNNPMSETYSTAKQQPKRMSPLLLLLEEYGISNAPTALNTWPSFQWWQAHYLEIMEEASIQSLARKRQIRFVQAMPTRCTSHIAIMTRIGACSSQIYLQHLCDHFKSTKLFNSLR